MNKTDNPLITKKDLLYITGGTVAVYAIATLALLASMIARYDTMGLYNHKDLESAKHALQDAQEHQSVVYTELNDFSYGATNLYTDKEYLEMLNQAITLDSKIKNGDKYSPEQYYEICNQRDKLHDAMALREDSLRRQYVNNHPDMIRADRCAQHAQIHFDNVKHDCNKLDSIIRVPKIQRIKSNWNKLCMDWRMLRNIKQK